MPKEDYKKQRGKGFPPGTIPDGTGLTFEQSENHRRMVEDMTGRSFKSRKQNL